MRSRGLTQGKYCLNPSGIISIFKKALPVILIAVVTGSCSVMSQHIRTESIPPMDFKILLENSNKYKGETVILGGYILEIDNLTDQTIIKVLQVPIGAGDEPKSRDYSEGRFIILQKGFLDPEIYSKDRKITVAGTVVGSVVEKVNEFSHPYLKIQCREIYLWPKDQAYPPAPYYDPWFYPYPFYWYPYRHYYPYYWYHHHPYYW